MLFLYFGSRGFVRFVIYDSFAKIGMSNLLSGQEGRQLLLFAASSFSKYILYHTIVYIYSYILTIGAAYIERSVGTHAEAALGGAINGLATWGLTWRKFPPKISRT